MVLLSRRRLRDMTEMCEDDARAMRITLPLVARAIADSLILLITL
jgi:hypothetical protein